MEIEILGDIDGECVELEIKVRDFFDDEKLFNKKFERFMEERGGVF